MKINYTLIVILGSILPSGAATFVTLTSPDGLWKLSSDEFGAYGEGVAGSFAQRNFGTALTGYSWESGVLLTNGGTSQWLSGPEHFGTVPYPGTALGATNLISDTTVANSRTSVYTTGAFPNLRISLTQSVTNAGINQQYAITNLGATTSAFAFVSFHDTDLDGGTFLDDIVTAGPGFLRVSQGGRNVFFSSAGPGYAGFLAAHVPPGGGVTGGANVVAQNNAGIPVANLNQFRDVSGGVIGGNLDLDGNGITDVAQDVGYLFQHNLSIPSNGTVTVNLFTSSVPEPASATLAGAFGLLALRRRRRV
jgi:hypothetical protein